MPSLDHFAAESFKIYHRTRTGGAEALGAIESANRTRERTRVVIRVSTYLGEAAEY
jgi:hypothetical protein